MSCKYLIYIIVSLCCLINIDLFNVETKILKIFTAQEQARILIVICRLKWKSV